MSETNNTNKSGAASPGTLVGAASPDAPAGASRFALARLRRRALLSLSVAVGTAALALAFQVSARLDRLVEAAAEGGGRRIVIANASIESDGSFDWQRPPAFSPADGPAFAEAGAGVRAASVVNYLPIREVEAGGQGYRPGTVAGTDERYAAVMGLSLLEGGFFSADDVARGAKSLVLSERAAVALFGGAKAAVGSSLRLDRGIFAQRAPGAQAGQRTESAFDAYVVAGVYRDASSFEREVFDLPDYILPWTAFLPAGMRNLPFARTFVALADSRDVRRVEAGLRSSLAKLKGEELKLSVWEGAPDQRGSTALARMRSALSGLSAAAKLFGLVILVVAGFGIASGMIAEAEDRRRELAIKRAIGLPSFRAAAELCVASLAIAAAGAAAGFALATVLGPRAWEALGPFIAALGIEAADLGQASFEAASLLAPLAALAIAPIFSAIPALKAAASPIVEGLNR